MRAPLFSCLLLPLACAHAPSEDPPARTSQAIVGGTETTGHPAVAALLLLQGDDVAAICSGTLISPRAILTAAHCFHHDGAAPATGVVAYFGASLADASDPHFQGLYQPASSGVNVWYPGSWTGDPLTGLGSDIALLFLEEYVPITPVGISRAPAGVGTAVQLVGWGTTGGAAIDNGVKREATSIVQDHLDEAAMLEFLEAEGVDEEVLEDEELIRSLVEVFNATLLAHGTRDRNTCVGDSGGPNLVGGAVAAVTSFGDLQCELNGFGTRVDLWAAEIEAQIMNSDPDACLGNECDPGDGGDPDEDDEDGGCSTGSGGGSWAFVLALLLGCILLRRRPCS